MTLLQACINVRDRVRGRWHYYRAMRLLRRNRAAWDAMTPEQQRQQADAFAEWTSKVWTCCPLCEGQGGYYILGEHNNTPLWTTCQRRPTAS